MNTKGMSDIIAVSLLLLFSVIMIGYYSSSQANTQTKIQTQSDQSNQDINLKFNVVTITNQYMFIQNDIDTLTITKVKIGNLNCNTQKNMTLGINNYSLSSCYPTQPGVYDLVISTNKGLYVRSERFE